MEVREYQAIDGKAPVAQWLLELRDPAARARIVARLDRLALILLLCGGDKRSQTQDIERAHAYWKDYKARKPKPPVPSGGAPAKRNRGRGLH